MRKGCSEKRGEQVGNLDRFRDASAAFQRLDVDALRPKRLLQANAKRSHPAKLHGHLAGDKVLSKMGVILRESSREMGFGRAG